MVRCVCLRIHYDRWCHSKCYIFAFSRVFFFHSLALALSLSVSHLLRFFSLLLVFSFLFCLSFILCFRYSNFCQSTYIQCVHEHYKLDLSLYEFAQNNGIHVYARCSLLLLLFDSLHNIFCMFTIRWFQVSYWCYFGSVSLSRFCTLCPSLNPSNCFFFRCCFCCCLYFLLLFTVNVPVFYILSLFLFSL